jgi:hypothetical protein
VLRRSSAVFDWDVNRGLGVEDPDGGFEAIVLFRTPQDSMTIAVVSRMASKSLRLSKRFKVWRFEKDRR